MKRYLLITTIFILFAAGTKAQVQEEGTMVLISGGEFIMGKNSDRNADYSPSHKVYVDSFYMDVHEVTNREYYKFCSETGHQLPEFWGNDDFKSGLDFPDYPVIGVSWFDAVKYAEWAGKRLPTEAEWEFAARGGLSDESFPAGAQLDSTLANFGRKYGHIIETGSLKPNGYGLFDMAGNVWEWTADKYSGTYYSESPMENPEGPEKSRFRVIRGGSWHSGAMCNRVYFRNGLSPNWVDFAVGFRCVRN